MGTIDGLLADRWMTREQIAQECGVSKQKISALVREHHLPARVQVRDGRVKLYHLAQASGNRIGSTCSVGQSI